MSEGPVQLAFYDLDKWEKNSQEETVTPAMVWDQDAAKRSLDELFTLTFQYKTSKAYKELLQFVKCFRSYSPFNAMLVHVQMPGAQYVSPPHRWLSDYKRTIKPGARPLVILQPMGPVMFVFDVNDTEPMEDAPPLPPEVENPFEVRSGHIGAGLDFDQWPDPWSGCCSCRSCGSWAGPHGPPTA